MPTLRNDNWLRQAIGLIEADYQRSADTHLIALPLPGSLKHRLARSLFLYALCNGWVRQGSTAVSEAYFARLLGLPFIAVMVQNTSPALLAH